jgi:hypothetical protein
MFENENLIRKIVKEELSKLIDDYLQHSFSKVYDEKNEMVETTFFEKIEEGHWIKVLTRDNNKQMKLFCEHVRTHENFTKHGFAKSEEINARINKEKIIGTEKYSGYALNNSGILLKE